jgi:putative peptidoglycan lipid II flippase
MAARVGAGIIVTRVLGFVRERLVAHFFGTGIAADAYGAALRIPNVIRNLPGDGTLSASFIPVYAGMIERGETEEAQRLSSVMASILVLLTAVAALLGIVLAPVITDFAAPGFTGRQRELTVILVRIMFPMSGALILSAWCLGILNTHRRFFLAYAAPAMWNIAQIATLVGFGAYLGGANLVVALAWGAVAGAVLQIVVQLPTVLRIVKRVSWGLDWEATGVRQVVRAWIPVVVGAGIVQISSIIDTQLASLLGAGAVATLRYAQLIAILPVSLFGVSVAAVALPELSRDVATRDDDFLRRRMATGIRQVAYFAVPSAFAFAAIGPQLAGALFQTGAFDASDTALVGGVLAAYAIAVPAQASIKLLASGHYAMGDTKTPVRIAAACVVVGAVASVLLMRHLGPAGIALGAAAGAYLNVVLNTWRLETKLGRITGRAEAVAFLSTGAGAICAAAAATQVTTWLQTQPVWVAALAGIGAFAVVFAAVTLILRNPEAKRIARSVLR